MLILHGHNFIQYSYNMVDGWLTACIRPTDEKNKKDDKQAGADLYQSMVNLLILPLPTTLHCIVELAAAREELRYRLDFYYHYGS